MKLSEKMNPPGLKKAGVFRTVKNKNLKRRYLSVTLILTSAKIPHTNHSKYNFGRNPKKLRR